MDKTWIGLQSPCDKIDEELFNASTVVNVGNGRTASFWKSNWIHGQAPKNIAPILFKKARKKNISVFHALRANSWIQLCLPCIREDEIKEFVTLWQAISSMHELWGTDIPRVHWKGTRPHERPKGPINHKVIPSWAWGGTIIKADRRKAGSVQARTIPQR
jgi:hypothetical protein